MLPFSLTIEFIECFKERYGSTKEAEDQFLKEYLAVDT